MSEKMLTIKEYLNLTKDEQSKIAGKLRPGPWKHELVDYSIPSHDDPFVGKKGKEFFCKKCKFVVHGKEDCSVPDPIPIDWNHAKALQGECGDDFDIESVYSIIEPYNRLEDTQDISDYVSWLLEADPIHYIAACLKVKGELE